MLLDRQIGRLTVVAAGVLELGFVVQAVVGIVAADRHGPGRQRRRVRRLPDRRAAGPAGRRRGGPAPSRAVGAQGVLRRRGPGGRRPAGPAARHLDGHRMSGNRPVDPTAAPGRVLIAVYAVFARRGDLAGGVPARHPVRGGPAGLPAVRARGRHLHRGDGRAGPRRPDVDPRRHDLVHHRAGRRPGRRHAERAAPGGLPGRDGLVDYGAGYGYVPLVLPVLGLWFLRSTRREQAAGLSRVRSAWAGVQAAAGPAQEAQPGLVAGSEHGVLAGHGRVHDLRAVTGVVQPDGVAELVHDELAASALPARTSGPAPKPGAKW